MRTLAALSLASLPLAACFVLPPASTGPSSFASHCSRTRSGLRADGCFSRLAPLCLIRQVQGASQKIKKGRKENLPEEGDFDIPEGWESAIDPSSGSTYYYNNAWETTWEKPKANRQRSIRSRPNAPMASREKKTLNQQAFVDFTATLPSPNSTAPATAPFCVASSTVIDVFLSRRKFFTNVIAWFAVSWGFSQIFPSPTPRRQYYFEQSEMLEVKAAAQEAMQNSAQAEIVDAVSTALADLVGLEIGPFGPILVPLFRPLALFVTDVAIDLKDEEIAKRRALQSESTIARMWRNTRNKEETAVEKMKKIQAALSNAAQQTTNVVVARSVAPRLGMLGPLGKFGYIFDSTAGPKILIKTFAKIEENLVQATVMPRKTTNSGLKLFLENLRDEATAREKLKKKWGFFDRK